ncbi:phospholipase D-like domain-containing protein [Microlunatus ginsengisoli]|uniref:Phospholipase D-like domain-containing protein n=1 Tax=Microlunatus ginsengisoli TaxID=363863 RepID=A0ABP6ZRQ3_9ACTN
MIRRHLRRTLLVLLGSLLAATGFGAAPTQAAPNWLATSAYFNDPRATGDASNVTRNLVIHHFDHAPAGSLVRGTTWNLTDTAISDAMVRAINWGVTVRLIVAKANCSSSAVAAVVVATIFHSSSYVRCTVGSARSAGGTMHQKSYTFSAVDGVRHVAVVGSANATVEGYADQWTDLFQFVNRKDVYDAYNSVFALQQRDRNMAKPYRSYSFNGGKGGAQFFPVNDPTPTAADDPVHARLTSLPKGRGTVIRVATYAMHGSRGSWLTNDLIAHARAGSTVVVLTGPPADDALERRLRAAGVSVTRAFDPGCSEVENGSCNYIHLKLMTATYVSGGARQYRVWTGSDNWSTDSLNNDEVTQKIAGKAPYDQYVSFIDKIRRVY